MSDALNLVWLVAAILVSLLVIVLALRLSQPLAELMGQGLKATGITASQTRLLARLVMVGSALIVAQAVLRWPVALVLGDGSAVPIDAGIAAAALAGVLVLLVWMYQTARPMVQALTLRAIDAAIPTTGEALVAEPTRTSASVVNGPIPSSTEAATIVAPLFVLPQAGEGSPATMLAGRGPDPDATLRESHDGEAGATLRARGAADTDATVRAGSDADATVNTRRAGEATVGAARTEEQRTVLDSGPDDKTLRVRDP